MKNSDVRLDRLFRAARKAAASDEAAEMPAHLKTRVLAHWRSGAAAEDLGLTLVRMFRSALVCGAVAMAITIAWSYADLTRGPQSYEDVENYVLRIQEMP